MNFKLLYNRNSKSRSWNFRKRKIERKKKKKKANTSIHNKNTFMLFSKIYSAEETERHKSWNLSSKNKIRIVTGDGIKKKKEKRRRGRKRVREINREMG